MKFVVNKLDGGGIAVEGSKSFPGGGARQKAHGGQVTVDDVTATLEIVPDRDLDDLKFCEARAGKADATLTEHRTDRDGNIIGRLNFWNGKLGDVNLGA